MMKALALIDSGYMEFNTAVSTDDMLVYRAMPNREVYIDSREVTKITRFIGPNDKTYLVEFKDAIGEGLSNLQRVFMDDDLKVSIYRIERTLVERG